MIFKIANTIYVFPKPKKTLYNGIGVKFDRDTETETAFAFADLITGQRVYSIPKDIGRKVVKVFLNRKTT